MTPSQDPATRSHLPAAGAWRPIPGTDPAEVLYGVIVSAATIGAVGIHVATNGRLVAVWAFVVLTYWLAHVYVHLVAHPFGGVHASLGQRVRGAVRDEIGVLVGTLPGLAVVLAVALFGGEPATAARLTLFITTGLLFVLGAFASRRLGSSLRRSIGEGLLASTLGVLMIFAKSLLH